MALQSPIALLYQPEEQRWYRYLEPRDVLCARHIQDVTQGLQQVEHRTRREGLYAVGFVSYEAASAFDPSLATHPPGHLPLLYFVLYARREVVADPVASLAMDNPDGPNARPDNASSSSRGSWRGPMPLPAYARYLQRLNREIGAGNVYQVNFTDRLSAVDTESRALFAQLSAQAPYAAFLETDEFAIISASPELFFARTGSIVRCRPMKGTAARGLTLAEDLRQRDWLQGSSKNRAENLMITDMVRNDLGRIARPGSVQVERLFEIERYPTVWQMTSTVQAETDASLLQVFTALFPGASITGAPKRASMALIRELETTPREIYTGALGVVQPDGSALFSIAIRTAWIDKEASAATYGVGGGIVWDSQVSEEYAELHAKSAVLRTHRPEFQLLETMRWCGDGEIYLLQRHLDRLADSAAYFGFDYAEDSVRAAIARKVSELDSSPARLRLTLDKQGRVSIECHELRLSRDQQPVALATEPVRSADPMLYHKTTRRSVYERAATSVPEGCEALLFNTAGQVTESSIANLVYRWQGRLYTPPLADGLLPGTLRQELLSQGRIEERSLPISELDAVQELWLINALRGWRRAYLATAAP